MNKFEIIFLIFCFSNVTTGQLFDWSNVLNFFNSCDRITLRGIMTCKENLSPWKMLSDEKELCW